MHFLRPLLLTPVVLARPWAMPQEATDPPPAMDGGEGEAAPPEEPAMTGRVIPVVVGGQQDIFVPNVVNASVGDVVQFQFSAGNHTVTQSAADAACVPLQMTDPTAVHSGHIPFQADQAMVGVFEMPVVSTDTMFMYCATGPHCQLGQIMVINPTDDQQVLDYAKLAQAAPENIDGTEVVGGTVSEIPLEQAAFDPPPAEEEGEAPPPPGDAPPAEEPPAEAPVEEAPVEEAPVEEAPVEEAPVEEAPVEEAPVEEAPVEEAPVEETPVEAPAENPGIVIVPLPSSADTPAATETATAGGPATTTVFVTVPAAAATAAA
ncbi:hypothetical protein DL764_008318 [Monosporascus ibericus]|uniref:Blue (type 1) copper domain-containing protein n=1 Tax=Monosporascus ibericus TaxID=155417 RepID=A0A4Q4T011_9PEZI|nr:hypothetical protein DL764_008318 [Monosporascus ibericus]